MLSNDDGDDDDSDKCANPSKKNDPCHFVIHNCGDVPALVNYLHFYFCELGDFEWVLHNLSHLILHILIISLNYYY